MQERSQVVAAGKTADVLDVRLRGQGHGEDRADLAAVTGDRDLDQH